MFSAAADLLVFGFARDAHRPALLLAAVRQRELVDQPVGRRGVDELPIGVRERGGVGDLRAARPARVARRRERPQGPAAVGVDRQRLAVGRGHDDRVVHGAVDEYPVQVDRRRVHGARQRHGALMQPADVRRGDPGEGFADVAALRIEPELGPVEQPFGGGAARRGDRADARRRGRDIRRGTASAGGQHGARRGQRHTGEVAGGAHGDRF